MTEEVPNIREVKMLPCSAGFFTHDNALALINCLDIFQKSLSGMAGDNKSRFARKLQKLEKATSIITILKLTRF